MAHSGIIPFVWSTTSLHLLWSWSTRLQTSNSFALYLHCFAKILERQRNISTDFSSNATKFDTNMWKWHSVVGHYQFLSISQNRQASIVDWLRPRTGQYFNAWKPTSRNWIYSYDTWIDLGWIYGRQRLRIIPDDINKTDLFPQELLGFSLPLINYHYVRRKLRQLASFPCKGTKSTNEVVKSQLTTISKCEYCGERPTLPHHMGCKHIFCYFCLKVCYLFNEKCCRAETNFFFLRETF